MTPKTPQQRRLGSAPKVSTPPQASEPVDPSPDSRSRKGRTLDALSTGQMPSSTTSSDFEPILPPAGHAANVEDSPSSRRGAQVKNPDNEGNRGYTQSDNTLGIMISVMIPIETQTLFAETLERARLADLDRSFGHLAGNFGHKLVSGDTFWYFRTSEGGQGRKEFYVGPDTDSIRDLISHYELQREEGASTRSQLQRMAAMLTHGGCMATDHVSAQVVDALATGGVFRMGGVLVGTHAYVALGNLLGVRWKSAIRTQDLDFAAFRTMEVAVSQMEEADIKGTLEALNMGFLPTPGLNPRSPHTSYHIRGKELKVDLLTTASRRGPFDPVFIPRFKAAALPMPYMDYLLEGNTEALVLAGNSATLVKVPNPARYGLHKLLVASERTVIEQTKVVKDITQALEMLSWLMQMRPVDVELAFERLSEKGLHKRALVSAQRHLGNESPVVQFLLDHSR